MTPYRAKACILATCLAGLTVATKITESVAAEVSQSGTSLVSGDQVMRAAVRLPLLWDKSGAVLGYAEVKTNQISGIPALTFERNRTSPKMTITDLANDIHASNERSPMRVYYADQQWSGNLNVQNVIVSQQAVSGIDRLGSWLGVIHPPLDIEFGLGPQDRVAVTISSEPADAAIVISGNATAAKTMFEGTLLADRLNAVVLKKNGYRDCDRATETIQRVTSPAPIVQISCKLIALP